MRDKPENRDSNLKGLQCSVDKYVRFVFVFFCFMHKKHWKSVKIFKIVYPQYIMFESQLVVLWKKNWKEKFRNRKNCEGLKSIVT